MTEEKKQKDHLLNAFVELVEMLVEKGQAARPQDQRLLDLLARIPLQKLERCERRGADEPMASNKGSDSNDT